MTHIKETQSRTIVKAVVYRILAVISIMVLSLFFGASAATAGKIGLTVVIIGTAIYYIHERVWLFTSWLRTDNGSDKISRSLCKTIIYRVLTLMAGIILGKVFLTDSNSMATLFGILQSLINMTLFYIVERAFNKIQWGKILSND
jgi:uncharacterized membrane protein